MPADFRYKMPDGTVIEAFQLTPATRYQEKTWPAWMNSKWLMTVDNKEWLNVNDTETEIPEFGWIVKHADGRIGVMSYEQMEQADKVVKEQPVIHPPAEVDEDKLLDLASKLTGKSVEELREEQLREGRVERKPPPDDTPQTKNIIETVRNESAPLADSGHAPGDLLAELIDIYGDMQETPVEAQERLRNTLSRHVTWCNCPPGQCAGGDRIGCRINSPLAK